MKIIIMTILILLLNSGETKEYKEFVAKYGTNTRTYCDGNFKMRETFLSPEASAPQEYLINSNECNEYKYIKSTKEKI